MAVIFFVVRMKRHYPVRVGSNLVKSWGVEEEGGGGGVRGRRDKEQTCDDFSHVTTC